MEEKSRGEGLQLRTGCRIKNYEIEKLLGQGSFSRVWLVRDVSTQQNFAMKEIAREKVDKSSTLRKLLYTEVAIMKQISHPNIIKLVESLETQHQYFLILEYLKDGDLDHLLRKTKLRRLDEATAIFYLKQISNGFQELRSMKVFHRDIKLANLFLSDNRLVIGDFGFAKQGVDQTSTALGSPITMAPEILFNLKNPAPYTSKADMWSIGVVYYQLLFGKIPFPGDSIEAIQASIRALAGKNLPFPGEISAESQDLLIRILTIDPRERIEWVDFFRHEVFRPTRGKTSASMSGLCSACQKHAHEESECCLAQNLACVDRNFSENTRMEVEADGDKSFEFSSTTELTRLFEMRPTSVATQRPDETAKRSVKNREIFAFFAHELAKTGFISFASNSIFATLEGLPLSRLAGDLVRSAFFCAKKAVLMNQKVLDQLRKRRNPFPIADAAFENFCDSELYTRVLGQFQLDIEHSRSWIAWAFREVEALRRARLGQPLPALEETELTAMMEDQQIKIKTLDVQIIATVTLLLEFLASEKPPVPSDDREKLLRITFLLKCVKDCHQLFQFSNPDKPNEVFNWKAFIAFLDALNLEQLERLVTIQEIQQTEVFETT